MKAVHARTLRTYIDAGTITVPDAVRLARHLAELIESAQSDGIVHHVLKPSNVILTRDGQGHLPVRLSGGGTSPNGDRESADETLESVSLRDDVRYMSPEECRGQTPNDRSAVYTAGVILYEMLAGRVPFDGDSAREVARKHIEESLLLKNLPPGDSQVVAPLITHAMHKNPEARPSAAEFARGLRHIECIVGSTLLTTREHVTREETMVEEMPTEASLNEEALIEKAPIMSALSPEPQPAAEVRPPAHDENPDDILDLGESDTRKIVINDEIVAEDVDALPREVAAVVEGHAVDEDVTREIRREAIRGEELHAQSPGHTSATPQPMAMTIQHHNFASLVEHTRGGADGQTNHKFTSVMVTFPDTPSRRPPTRARVPVLLAGVLLTGILATLGVWWLMPSSGTTRTEAENRASSDGNQTVGDATSPAPSAADGLPDEADVLGVIPEVPGVSSRVAAKPAASSSPQQMVKARGTPTAKPRANLRMAFDQWVAAMSSRNVNEAMSFYVSRLAAYNGARNVPKSTVRRAKLRLMRGGTLDGFEVGEPEISFSPDGRTALMRFRRSYSVRGRKVEVTHELRWVLTGGEWKISSERDLRTAT
ncbi:MAG: protein kinase [Pyrinomonadaceae bacterium MAG19_C2-C3]|nr:protein kinase [Pyrinomonadaceae bacterium MAG19_C2-C3]